MKHTTIKSLSLPLSLLLLFALVPAAFAAEGDGAGTSAEAADITLSPARGDGHVLFDETLTIDGEETTLAHVLAERCKAATGSELSYISYVAVSPTQGTLYDGYNSEGDTGAGVAGLEKYYNNDSANYKIKNIEFVPNTTFSGRAVITYYGYSADTPAKTYAGRVLITVSKQVPGISYSTDGEAVRFSADDFSAYSLAVTGRTFRYVSFKLPASSQGALYYNYLDESVYDSAVTASGRYYRSSSPYLGSVSFVPKKGWSGTLALAFTGVDAGGADFSGTVNINVTDNGPGFTERGPFIYSVASGRTVALRPADFESQTQSEAGAAFSYFRIASLPSASSGTLYVNVNGNDSYAEVNKSYSSPESLRFSASGSFTGEVDVPIICFGVNGSWYDATLRFLVGEAETSGESPLRYTVDPGKRVTFIASDFSDACLAATGYDVSRVRFESLPNASQGTLYLNGAEPVTTDASSYYTRENLSELSFLAAPGFSGTVTIPFTGYAVGYAGVNSRAFSGTVTIASSASAEEAPAIGGTSSAPVYSTTGRAVALRSDLLNAASASLPAAPSTIRISAPPEACGTFYLDYVSPAGHSAFNARQSYPVSDVSRISFLPKADYSGSFTVDYTVTDAKGNSYTGSLRFNVTPPAYSSYFSDLGGSAWAIPAADFLASYGVINGTGGGRFSPSSPMKRCDYVLMLSRVFSFPNAGTYSYADVPQTSYYAAAAAGAKAAGILGDGARFDPQAPITREDAAVMLCRCLGSSVDAGTAADLAAFSDSGSVSAGAVSAMGALVRLGVFRGSNGRLRPQSALSRAEMVTILYRALA